ncbi:uncharacterized protein MYCFIDRAFT_180081 [Pseudocercospora fijiensis CIRAD86]|uniref:Uncharacterized protein n=1 Tax=Pseudocercospora fijiensis (strain CIRAD86) TaxID=383855 RepID=M2ZDN1_PSEFD|nr:uncharacterized protein MYCFIDRAFT_180081 [Pseudocercospora fijiensis CIRAD86]EME77204.1 hypothetical protein MYCFIDRAFT_180081 [Pseudocercospora fijiensis CIRAD86]
MLREAQQGTDSAETPRESWRQTLAKDIGKLSASHENQSRRKMPLTSRGATLLQNHRDTARKFKQATADYETTIQTYNIDGTGAKEPCQKGFLLKQKAMETMGDLLRKKEDPKQSILVPGQAITGKAQILRCGRDIPAVSKTLLALATRRSRITSDPSGDMSGSFESNAVHVEKPSIPRDAARALFAEASPNIVTRGLGESRERPESELLVGGTCVRAVARVQHAVIRHFSGVLHEPATLTTFYRVAESTNEAWVPTTTDERALSTLFHAITIPKRSARDATGVADKVGLSY